MEIRLKVYLLKDVFLLVKQKEYFVCVERRKTKPVLQFIFFIIYRFKGGF